MEKLYAEFLLWLNELNTNEKYESLLHKYFLNAPSDKVLLELEECSSDIQGRYGKLFQDFAYGEISEFGANYVNASMGW